VSFTDPVDDVQPQGQGEADTTTDAPYQEYLNRIPEEAREQAESAFREWDANQTRRFQDAAEFRQRWEPYQDTGIASLPPEEVQQLVQFRGALSDPQAIQQWYQQYAAQAGLTEPQAPPQEPYDPYQEQDPYGGGFDGIDQVLANRLGPIEQRLERFAQWQEQQDHAARVAEAENYVQGQLEELKQKHPEEFNEQAIEKLVVQYIETDPRNAVQRAFADWQGIRSEIERQTLQAKANTPPAAEGGGYADTNPEEIKTLAQAAEIAKAQIRQSWGH